MAERYAARSLLRRVLGAVLSILLLGGLMVAASTWRNGQQAARQAYDRILLGAASDISESIRIQDGTPVVDLPVSAFELLAQAPDDRIYYTVRKANGEVITSVDGSLGIHIPDHRGGATAYFDAELNGEPARFVRVVHRFAERDFSGPVEVVVGQTLRARKAMTAGLVRDTLLPMVMAGLALVLIAWLVVRTALRPLEAITEDLAQRDPYDLTPMATDRLPRELQVMLAAMNRFMGRLDGQIDAMRNLISDTAHQLRTPVAAIRVQAETAMTEAEGSGHSRAMRRLLSRTRSLGDLLEQLLSRALVVHRTDSVSRVPVDLREVALEIVERNDHALLTPGVDLRLEIDETPVMMRGDAFSLGEAAINLLGNALKHGKPPVTVGAGQYGRTAVLWVRDAGPGPDPAIIERLGDRFNRNAGSYEKSTGIGLSIVQSVAAAFDGSVQLNRDKKGFSAALVFPACVRRP